MTLLGAGLFFVGVAAVALTGLRLIASPVVRAIFAGYSVGVLLMLAIPAVWHAGNSFSTSGPSSLGFIGFRLDPLRVLGVLPSIYLGVLYVFGVTTWGFFVLSRVFPEKRCSIPKAAKPVGRSVYLLIGVLLLICIVFFTGYYGSFGSILLLRDRESVALPIHYELLRAGVVGACTFSVITLMVNRFTRSSTGFLLALVLLVFSLALIVGFGSRNLLIFPLFAVILSIALGPDRALRRRNYVFGAVVFLLLVALAGLQSNFRYTGAGEADLSRMRGSNFFLAFDQFESLCLALRSYDRVADRQARLPFCMAADVFLYVVPRAWFEVVGLTKMAHANYIEWNDFVTGSVNSNITPSFVGQSLIENRVVGFLLLPFDVLLVVAILLRFLASRVMRTVSPVIFITCLALVAGGVFNCVRMLSGGYLLYFFVFASVGVGVELVVGALWGRKRVGFD